MATQIAQDVRDIATLHQAVLGVRADTVELQNEVTAQKLQLNAAFAKLTTAKDHLKTLQDAAKTELANEQGAYNKLAQNKSALAAAIKKATAAKAALTKKIASLVAAQQNQGTIPSVYNGTPYRPMNGSVFAGASAARASSRNRRSATARTSTRASTSSRRTARRSMRAAREPCSMSAGTTPMATTRPGS